ncbi:hypothetical protein L1887_42461 [Cichorium endivia]|nr:hypothetical protein L1887_42461 [Cichorium endivia]
MSEFKLPGPQGFEETINMSNWDVFFYNAQLQLNRVGSQPTPCQQAPHLPHHHGRRHPREQPLHQKVAQTHARGPSQHDRPASDPSPQGRRQALRSTRCASLSIARSGIRRHLDAQGRVRTSNYYGVPSRTVVVSEGLTVTTIQSKYEDVHAQLEPFDAYTDVFFAFSPGFGFPSQIAVEEADQARQDERDHEAHFARAKSTYHAAGAESAESTEASAQKAGRRCRGAGQGADRGASSSRPVPRVQFPDAAASPSRAAYTVDATSSPEGGDVPSEEPAPVLASADGHHVHRADCGTSGAGSARVGAGHRPDPLDALCAHRHGLLAR